jgi:hypothetical protein
MDLPKTFEEWKEVDTVNDPVNVTEEPLVELAEGSDNEVVELYSMEI